MPEPTNGRALVVAEDDRDYYTLVREAMREAQVDGEPVWVADGEDCLDYLLRRGRFAGLPPALPAIVLLDLNMPRKNGHQTLAEMKAHPALRRIPVVVLTVSSAEEDVRRAYELGASSFIEKPTAFSDLVEIVRAVGLYWLDVVRLPT